MSSSRGSHCWFVEWWGRFGPASALSPALSNNKALHLAGSSLGRGPETTVIGFFRIRNAISFAWACSNLIFFRVCSVVVCTAYLDDTGVLLPCRVHYLVCGTPAPELDRSGFEFWLCCLPVVWPSVKSEHLWASDSSSFKLQPSQYGSLFSSTSFYQLAYGKTGFV